MDGLIVMAPGEAPILVWDGTEEELPETSDGAFILPALPADA